MTAHRHCGTVVPAAVRLVLDGQHQAADQLLGELDLHAAQHALYVAVTPSPPTSPHASTTSTPATATKTYNDSRCASRKSKSRDRRQRMPRGMGRVPPCPPGGVRTGGRRLFPESQPNNPSETRTYTPHGTV